MSEVETAEIDSADTEFEAARIAEEADVEAVDAPETEEGESEPEVTVEDRLAAAEEKYANLQKALAAERGTKRKEREAREALERKIADLEAKILPKEPDIDPETDPIEAIKQLKARQAVLEKQSTKSGPSPAEARFAEIKQAEAEYASENPEYMQASEYFKGILSQEIEDEGFYGKEAESEFFKRVEQIVDRADRAGLHPCELVMKLSKRAGFDPAKAAAKPTATTTPKGADSTQEALEAAKRELEKARKAAAQKSISTAPTVGKDGVDINAYFRAKTDAEKDAVFEKLRAQEKRGY